MRAVLALALVLLGLTLVLNHAHELFEAELAPDARADRALELVLGAKGPLLPAARIGTGPEVIGEAMRVGDRTLVGGGADGLRTALLGPDHALLAQGFFDVAHDPAAARALAAQADGALEGAVLLVASSGRLEPEGDGPARAALDALLARLGAAFEPGRTTPESWALIARRREGRWNVLAEGYSRDCGVALAWVLGAQGRPGEVHELPPERAWFHAPARSEVELAGELQHAALRTSGVAVARERFVGSRRLEGILVPPLAEADGGASPGRLVWRDVPIGPDAGLVTWPGVADDGAAGSEGVTFVVRVDGQPLARRAVRPGQALRPWLVDLRPFAGRTIELELAVEPGAGGEPALWGRATLFQGYERSPLEVWADER